jgi:transcriptional regulator with XRE-family HTH domain
MNEQEKYNSIAIDSILSNLDPKLEKQVEFRMKLAAKIDCTRKKLGWSKKLLAEKLSKRPSEISKWLSGTHNFTSDTLFEIQYIMGVELINIDDKPKSQSIHFSIEVTQKEAISAFSYSHNRPFDYTKLYSKSQGLTFQYPD